MFSPGFTSTAVCIFCLLRDNLVNPCRCAVICEGLTPAAALSGSDSCSLCPIKSSLCPAHVLHCMATFAAALLCKLSRQMSAWSLNACGLDQQTNSSAHWTDPCCEQLLLLSFCFGVNGDAKSSVLIVQVLSFNPLQGILMVYLGAKFCLWACQNVLQGWHVLLGKNF